MNWNKVESSNIKAIAHDGTTMGVSFHSGAVYAYDNVPRGVFDEVVVASSVGRAFHHMVRSNPDLYPYRKI